MNRGAATPYDHVVLPVQFERLSQHLWTREEVLLPELVSQDRHRLRILPIDCVRGQKSPPQHRGDTQIVKAARDQTDRVDIFREVVPGQSQGMVIHGQQALDHAQLPHLLDLRTIQIDPIPRVRLALHRQAHDAVDGGIGIRIHQRGIDHAEYRRRRPNAERQRDHRRQRESRTLDELP